MVDTPQHRQYIIWSFDYGRMANQLITLGKGLHIARTLGRTAVLQPFFLKENGVKVAHVPRVLTACPRARAQCP